MLLSGQTPLYRAINLEKYLGVEKIYLKLEGNNPTGHKRDRICESLVKYYKNKDINNIIIHGSKGFLESLIYFLNYYKINYKIAIGKNNSLQNDTLGIDVSKFISIYGENTSDEIESLKDYSKKDNFEYITEWEDRPLIKEISLETIGDEIFNKINNIDNVYVQMKNAHTSNSLYVDFVRKLILNQVDKLPNLICGVNKNDDISKINNSHTKIVNIEKEKVLDAISLIKKIENVEVSEEGGYSLAAFLKNPKDNETNIIILNDGKIDLNIKEVDKKTANEEIINKLTDITMRLLKPYNDTMAETKDAIITAINEGFIFYTNNKDNSINGICVVVPSGFKDFIPSYHLAYIGVEKGNSGKGIATILINEAINKSKGNISLHVDMPNKRAKALYEKLGFKHKYERMIYND